MKKTLIASALAVFASAALADNTHQIGTSLVAYVSQGVNISSESQLSFPDIVKPATGKPDYTVTVNPSDGSVSYVGLGAPGGGVDGSNKQNTSGSGNVGQRDAAVGTITLSAEPGYTFTLSITRDSMGGATPDLSYSSLVGPTDSPGSAIVVMDPSGSTTINYGGTLTVGADFDDSTSATTTIDLIARVDYM